MSDTAKWLLVDRALALSTLSTATCVVYDHLTTLADEVELVWKRPKWGVVQYLFLINRYVGDGLQIATAFVLVRHIVMDTTESCNIINVIVGLLAAIVLAAMQGIMSYRVACMSNRSRKIVILLITAFALEVFSVVLIQLLTLRVNTPVPQPAPGVQLCTADSIPSWLYTVWIPILTFELLVLVLSISSAIQYHQSLKFMNANGIETRKSLRYILLRDSITFPFICAAICILNLIIYIRFDYLITQFSFTLAAFVPIILGPRLVLNLRETYYQPLTDELEPENHIRSRGRITSSYGRTK